MTNRDLLSVSHVLGELANKNLPIPTALSVARKIRKITSALEPYNNVRETLLTEELDNGVEERFEELLDQEVEIEIEPIKTSTLGEIDIKPAVLFVLEEKGLLEDNGDPSPNRAERRRKS